jgi:methylmalonyl-CoA mutase cobalamin-binding domain/chain
MNAHDWSDELLNTMVMTDRTAAAGLIERALADGHPPDRLLTDVLDPALVRLGQMWERELASVAQTFVAAKIAEDVLQRCLPRADQGPSRPFKGRIVIGNIEDDFHSLGRRIVASFLLAAGWEVHDLGNDAIAELFVDRALAVDACVVGVSAMTQTTALNIRKVRDLIDARGLTGRIKLAVGGAVFNWRPVLVTEVGGDGTALNAAGADALCTRLQAEARITTARPSGTPETP